MKLIVQIARFIVAITFIFSGFVKLVDPLGSAYKFEEYFGANVLNLEFLIPYALPFAILLIIAEIMLGVMLLVGYLPKFTTWALLFISLIFLFLTWYSAYYNKVTDCGCFGDAIKLSTWGTFYKNIVLIVLVLLLVSKYNLITPIFSNAISKWVTFISFFAFLFITYYVLMHLPIIDFRPYAVGNNIKEAMQFVGDEEPKIYDFYLENSEGEEVTNQVLNEDKVVLIVMYNLSKSDKEGFSAIKTVTDNAKDKGYTIYGLSASLEEDFLKIKEAFDLNFNTLFCDETVLKTIIRANPGIVIVNDGTVVGKWNWTDADDVKINE